MNEIMKMLTIVSSIFIPLTFTAGIYGMNFQFILELNSKYGYFFYTNGYEFNLYNTNPLL
jgi:magnesium transporter